MPLTSADVQAAIAAGLTRAVTYSIAAPTGGIDGDWWIPGPSTAPGVYFRDGGSWTRIFMGRTPAELVAGLMSLSGTARLDFSAIKNGPPAGVVSLPAIAAGASMAVTDATWKATGHTIPATATWMAIVLNGGDYVRGTYFLHAPLWRALDPVAAADPVGIGPQPSKLRLAHYLFFSTAYQLSAGRTTANEVMIQYDGATFDGGTWSISIFAG